MLATVIANKYVVVNKLYRLNDKIAKIFDTVNKNQVIRVSLQGSIYDFLNVGIYPRTSIAVNIIIERIGLSNCHQIKIAQRAAIKIIVSSLVIFFVPYLKENAKTTQTSIVPVSMLSKPQFPPPYHIPASAVPCVRIQISQV